MTKITKIILISMIILGLGTAMVASAQEDITTSEANDGEIIEEVKLDEIVKAEDLEIEEPKILPDSPFYILKEWGRGIQSFFAFGRIKKAELESKFANEKLMELKKITEQGKNPEIIKKAIEKYEKTLKKISFHTEKIKEKAEENEKVGKFLDKFTRHQLLHQKILQKLENQVPKEVFEKIKEARERHLEKFGEIMIKLEDREEKIKERLEKTFEEQKGSKFKDFKNLEILKELEEKVPEQAKEAIRKVQENIRKNLQEDLEKMSSTDQEKFKKYIDKISGDKEKHFEILENIKIRIENAPQLQRRLIEAREKVQERIQEKVVQTECKTDADCPRPKCIITTTATKCIGIETKCVEGKCAYLKERPEICVMLWAPVCGKDGRTYSNDCFSKVARIEVDYKGKCETKTRMQEIIKSDINKQNISDINK